MNLTQAKSMLPKIREVVGLASEEWTIVYDLESGRSQVCGRDVMTGEVYPIATLEQSISSDDRELIQNAPTLIRAALLLRDEAVSAFRQATRTAEPPKPDPKDFAAEVAMKCKSDLAFAKFLIECHQLHDASDGERIKTRVRSILAVQSLAELNNDHAAADRWLKLRGDFKAWLRAAR